MKDALLDIKHEAILKKQEGDTRNLLDIIFSSWTEQHPHSKATKASLKICLSKLSKADTLKNEQCTPTTKIIPTKIKVNDVKTVDNSIVVQKGATCTGTINTQKTSSGQMLKSRMNTPPADRDIHSILHCYKAVVAR